MACRLSWVSKPLMETKNTCLLDPRVDRAAMSRATILSWSPSLLPVGNGVARLTLLRAELIWVLAEMERALTRAYSFSNRLTRVAVMSWFNALLQAAEPNRGDCKPATGTDPVGVIWYCTAVLPDR